MKQDKAANLEKLDALLGKPFNQLRQPDKEFLSSVAVRMNSLTNALTNTHTSMDRVSLLSLTLSRLEITGSAITPDAGDGLTPGLASIQATEPDPDDSLKTVFEKAIAECALLGNKKPGAKFFSRHPTGAQMLEKIINGTDIDILKRLNVGVLKDAAKLLSDHALDKVDHAILNHIGSEHSIKKER